MARRRITSGLLACVAAMCLAAPAMASADLTATEALWLEASLPVLAFARQQGLPLDVVVQPQDAPEQPPLGMAYVDGRCKFVLSMRGNPQARATTDQIPPGLREPVIQAMAAHELGHCWRHTQARWGLPPATLHLRTDFSRVTAEQAELIQTMWQVRREEGFADLVGLAWTLQHHPARYAEVHAWLAAARADQELDGAHHDTRVWVRLARDTSGFTPGGSIFEQVEQLWVDGLVAGF